MEVFLLSTELQMVIVFGFFILLLMVAGFYIIRFPRRGELKLLYAILNIVSLISLLVYVFFLYKQSSPIICGIIDYALKAIQDPTSLYLDIILIFSFVFLTLCSSPMMIIMVIITDIYMEIIIRFQLFIDEVYDLIRKFIHCLRNLFKLRKDK